MTDSHCECELEHSMDMISPFPASYFFSVLGQVDSVCLLRQNDLPEVDGTSACSRCACRACMHYHSRGWSRPGLTVTTALFGQSSSATMFKSFREQVHPNTVRNKQDIFENLGGFSNVKFPRREGGSIDGKKNNPQLPSSSKNRSPRQYLGILQDISCKTKAKNFDRHCSENSKGVLSHLLQSNSHHEHPLRFAPNWFDDVMMTMCNGTIFFSF